MKARGQKFQFSNFLVNWGKVGNAIQAFQKSRFFLRIRKYSEIYTVPDQHFKIQILNLWMSWENLCPNLTFTGENKIWNSHKTGWSHFKLNKYKLLRYSIL